MELPQIALGCRLRQARLSRGLTIGDVSALTKISTRALLAIECEDFDRLPGGIFRRAYIVAFADAVGLDGRECGRAYVEAFEPPATDPAVERRSGSSQTLDWLRRHVATVSVGVLVVSGFALVILSMAWIRPMSVSEGAPSDLPSLEASLGAPAVPVVASASDVAAIDAPGLVRVRVTASAECWISAVADGVRVWQGRLGPGDDVDVEARTLLTLRVGDAGAVTYTIDGAPAKALGAPGQPATVVLTPESSEQFLLNHPSSAL